MRKSHYISSKQAADIRTLLHTAWKREIHVGACLPSNWEKNMLRYDAERLITSLTQILG